jgi:hypothetical protein
LPFVVCFTRSARAALCAEPHHTKALADLRADQTIQGTRHRLMKRLSAKFAAIFVYSFMLYPLAIGARAKQR